MAGADEEVVVALKGDISDLNRKVDEARAHMRQVFEDTGKKGGVADSAFAKQFGSDLDELEKRFNKTFKLIEDGAADVEAGLGRSTGSLTQLFSDIGPGLLVLQEALKSLEAMSEGIGEIAAGAGRTWHQLGEEVRSSLGDEVANALDSLGEHLKALTSPSALIKQFFKDYAQANRETAESIEGVSAAEEKASKQREAAARERGAEAMRIREAAQALIEKDTALDKESDSLVRSIGLLEKLGLVNDKNTGQLETALRKQLDAYEKVGEVAPEALQKVADKYSVVSTAALKAAEAEEKAAERRAEAAVREAEKAAEGVERVRESVRGSSKDLEETTIQVIAFAQEVAKLGSGAPHEESEKARKDIQELLDKYAELGKEPPEDLTAVAAAWKVTTTENKKQIEENKKALQSLSDAYASFRKQLTGKSADIKQNATEELAKLIEERNKLTSKGPLLDDNDSQRLMELDSQISELSATVSDFAGQWTHASKDVKINAADIKQAVTDLFLSIQDDLGNLSQEQRDALQDTLNQLSNLGSKGEASSNAVNNALERVAQTLQEAGVNTAKLEGAIAQSKGEAVDFNRIMDDFRDTSKKGAGEVANISKASEEAAANQEEMVKHAKALREELDGIAGDAAEKVLSKMKAVTAEMKQLRAEAEATAKALAGAASAAGTAGGSDG